MADQQLADMLAVPLARARELLAETGGEVESAVALHFANPTGRPQEPQSPRLKRSLNLVPPPDSAAAAAAAAAAHPPSPPPLALRRSELCALLGGSISLAQAAQLLRRAGNSVAAAADLYFEDPSAAGGAAPGRAAGRQHRGDSSDPITMSDSEAGTTEQT